MYADRAAPIGQDSALLHEESITSALVQIQNSCPSSSVDSMRLSAAPSSLAMVSLSCGTKSSPEEKPSASTTGRSTRSMITSSDSSPNQPSGSSSDSGYGSGSADVAVLAADASGACGAS